MQATSSVSRPVASVESSVIGSRLLSIGEVSARYGVHPNSVRNWIASGDLPAVRTLGGHRRVSWEACLQYFEGVSASDLEEEKDGVPIALVARVSGGKQARGLDKGEESDLTRQVARLRDYIKGRWNGAANVTEYCRVASGLLFSHPVLTRLVADILAGKFRGGYVVCENPDRLVRFGRELIEQVCRVGGCELVYVAKGDKEETEEESLSADVIALMTCFSAKIHGRRAAAHNPHRMPPATLKRALELCNRNLPVVEVVAQLKREGLGTISGRAVKPNQVYHVLRKGGAKLYRAAMGESGKAGSPVMDFLTAETEKKEGGRVLVSEVVSRYQAWAKARGLGAPNATQTGLALRTLPRVRCGGRRYIKGFAWKS